MGATVAGWRRGHRSACRRGRRSSGGRGSAGGRERVGALGGHRASRRLLAAVLELDGRRVRRRRLGHRRGVERRAHRAGVFARVVRPRRFAAVILEVMPAVGQRADEHHGEQHERGGRAQADGEDPVHARAAVWHGEPCPTNSPLAPADRRCRRTPRRGRSVAACRPAAATRPCVAPPCGAHRHDPVRRQRGCDSGVSRPSSSPSWARNARRNAARRSASARPASVHIVAGNPSNFTKKWSTL